MYLCGLDSVIGRETCFGPWDMGRSDSKRVEAFNIRDIVRFHFPGLSF